jgi:hypothetical protein
MGRKRKVLKEIDLNGDGYDYDEGSNEVVDSTSDTIDKKISMVTSTLGDSDNKRGELVKEEGKQDEKLILDSTTTPPLTTPSQPVDSESSTMEKKRVVVGRKRKPPATPIESSDNNISQIKPKKQQRQRAISRPLLTTTTTTTNNNIDKERQYEETIRRRLEKEYEDRERKRIREEKKMEEKVRRMVEQQLYMHNMATYQPRVNSGIKRVSVTGGKHADYDHDYGDVYVETQKQLQQIPTDQQDADDKENVQPKVDRRDQLFTMIFRR